MLDNGEAPAAMSEPVPAPARRGPRRLLPDAELLEAACALVQIDGLAGLTLRPLAQRLEVSVQVLSTRYGARAKVLAAIAQAALSQDQGVFEPWLRRIDALTELDAPLAADIADQVLVQLSDTGGRAQLFVEMVQASAWDEEMRAALAPWLAAHARLWNRLAQCARVPRAVCDSGLIAGYFLDELAYSLPLAQLPAYRLLRKLGLRRLFSAFLVGAEPDAAMFRQLFAELDYPQDALSVSHAVHALDGWRQDAARACAVTITTKGVSAVTHRAIAEIAGVPHSTLAYRFATHEDLVVCGLEFIISHLLQDVAQGRFLTSEPAPRPNLQMDIGRATFAVAIAANHMQRLVPCAADMRRQRGINLLRVLEQRGDAAIGLDFLSAQVLSIALIGRTSVTLAQMAPNQSSQSHDSALTTALEWARQRAATATHR